MDYILDEQYVALNKEHTICSNVRETVESAGWKNTIGPIIDRMIIDVLGGKLGNVWVSGKLDRARKDEKREYYIGYKQALIDLHGRINFHVDRLPAIEDDLKRIADAKKDKFRVPLVDDTRYRL